MNETQSADFTPKLNFNGKVCVSDKLLELCFKKRMSLNVTEFSVSTLAKAQSKEQKYLLVLVLKQKILQV